MQAQQLLLRIWRVRIQGVASVMAVAVATVLARNSVRVRNVRILELRNVRNVRNVRNMFGPRLFGTFGPNQPKSSSKHTSLVKSPKVQKLQFGDVSFDLGFEW